MKIKLPVTEQFLLDFYALLQETSSGLDLFKPKSLQDSICYESYKLRKDYERYRNSRSFEQMVGYLKDKGYIRKTKSKIKGVGISLTPEGAEKILKAQFKADYFPKRKDGKWLMLMFDIPHKHKELRDMFRWDLKNLGYKQLQKSVWVTRRDVYKKTQEAISIHDVRKYVKLFLIKEI